MDFGPVRHPPVGAPSGYSYPPAWQLQELEEELEEDGEGDGKEEEPILEEPVLTDEDPNYKSTASSYAHMGPAALPSSSDPNREPSEGKGALGKILRIVSSSKRKPAAKQSKQSGPAKGHTPEEEEEEADIKGFDNFFLY
jgi:hypothetical protein